MTLNIPAVDIAGKFEAFVLLGLEGQISITTLNERLLTLKNAGAAHKYMNSVTELKKSTSKLIHEKLSKWLIILLGGC